MITLSLCMIVKDEEAALERILAPMRQAADEILIADTGSSDRTPEIARKWADQVYSIPWNQDFSQARNFICSKASMDYWMWLDGDDLIQEDQLEALKQLKADLDPSIDVVMMKYVTALDQEGRPAFSFYRERLLKNRAGFQWQGPVHEAVVPRGNIFYSDIQILHDKVKTPDRMRNLKIYQAMLEQGQKLEPRHQYYYGRELYGCGDYSQAAQVFQAFLQEPEGWVENQVDACLLLCRCLEQTGSLKEAFQALFQSFLYSRPRRAICCEAGRLFLNAHKPGLAAFWYEQALQIPWEEEMGGFVQEDLREFIPCIQLCLCYDQLGQKQKAYEYHLGENYELR